MYKDVRMEAIFFVHTPLGQFPKVGIMIRRSRPEAGVTLVTGADVRRGSTATEENKSST